MFARSEIYLAVPGPRGPIPSSTALRGGSVGLELQQQQHSVSHFCCPLRNMEKHEFG